MKEKILKKLEPYIEEVIEFAESQNTDLQVGVITRWTREAETDNMDAITKLGLIPVVLRVLEEELEDTEHDKS